MPYINLKIVKDQVTSEKKKELVKGLTDLTVEIMGRDRSLTVITVDELEASQWSIGGITLEDAVSKNEIVTYINIKVSKGTTNPKEMDRMMKATKELIIKILGSSEMTNYFVIDELNPDAWGFDGVSMTERKRMEQ